jgi:hypothetical protein
MSDEAIKKLKKALKEQGKKINASKEEAKKFLTESGILTAKGDFKKEFKISK